jgi:hypothetical protein
MATRQELFNRAKEIIRAQPTAGKERINYYLRAEYGVGLRSSKVLELKREVAKAEPKLAPELYRSGGYRRGYRDIYNDWRKAGFLPYEARELTIGGGRLSIDGSRKVFDSMPGKLARRSRERYIVVRLREGKSPQEIRQMIVDSYKRSLGTLDKHGKPFSPWTHIRDEYKPRKKVKKKEYKQMKRASRAYKRRAEEH